MEVTDNFINDVICAFEDYSIEGVTEVIVSKEENYGSVNSDNAGLNGVELQYDSELRGTDGYKIAEIDGSFSELPYQTVQYSSPIDGVLLCQQIAYLPFHTYILLYSYFQSSGVIESAHEFESDKRCIVI